MINQDKADPQSASEIARLADLALKYMWDVVSRTNWVEPYLLMAYLLDNPRVNIYFGSNLATNRLPEESAVFMGGKQKAGGGSFWFKQKGRT